MNGDLADFRLAELVKICGRHVEDVRLTVRRWGEVTFLYFSSGELVHAENGTRTGKGVFFDLLTWKAGTFELVTDVPPPATTITEPMACIFEEVLCRKDRMQEAVRAVLGPKSEKAVLRIASAEDSCEKLAEAARDAVKFARLFASREAAEDLRKRLAALCGQEI
jgi:hypothetical protein